MKRSLKSIILLCVLALCIGGYLFINNQTEKQTAASTEVKEAVALTAHTTDELTALSWTGEDGEIRFTKTVDGWEYAADNSFPADKDSLDTLTGKLITLEADRSIDNVTDLSIYGLAEPSFTVAAEWSDGTSTTYSMGSATTFSDGYYVSRSDDENVYILSTSLEATFGKALADLAVKEPMPEVTNVTRVTTDAVDASYEETSRTVNTDAHWYAADGTVLNGDAVDGLIDDIKALSFGDLVTGYSSDEALAGYNLSDNASQITLYDGGNTVLTLLIGSTDEDGNYYARLAESKAVYTIAATDLTSILAATENGLKADTLLTLPYADVQTALFTTGNISYTLETIDLRTTEATEKETASAESTDAPEATAEPQEDPTADDETLWQQVTSITGSGTADHKDGDTVLTISLTNVNGTSAELLIREYDADQYQASLDGSAAVTVSADKVDKLVRMLKQLQ